MRTVMLGFALITAASCASNNINLKSEVGPRRLMIVGVHGDQVTITNLGPREVELRRRAPSGEVVGTSNLMPGRSFETSAKFRRAVELVNHGAEPVAFSVRVLSSEGTASVVILDDQALDSVP